MMKSVTKEKVFHVLKLVLLAVTVTLVLLSPAWDGSSCVWTGR